MKKRIILLLLSLFISSCSLFHLHTMDVEQGNILSPKDVNSIRLGMTEDDVKGILGNPVLVNIFSKGQIYYVYSLRKADGTLLEKKLTLIFNQGWLAKIQYS